VIAEEGYDHAGTQEIARRAGLTNGAIYANFRDKSELLAEAVEAGLQRLFGRMDEARRSGASAAQVVEAIGRTLALGTPARNRKLLCEALAAAGRDPAVGERVRPLLATVEEHVAAVVAEARREGDYAEDVDPATVARFGTAVALGYHVIYSAGLPEPNPEAWTRLMAGVLASLSRSA
jgi:AcrR family transcriptional regulator